MGGTGAGVRGRGVKKGSSGGGNGELKDNAKKILNSKSPNIQELQILNNKIRWSNLNGSNLHKQVENLLVKIQKGTPIKIKRKALKRGTPLNPIKGEIGYSSKKK